MILIKQNVLQAAGHFPNLPMLAASMALGNMTHAISMFSDGRGGLQRFTTKKHLLKIYGMVRPPFAHPQLALRHWPFTQSCQSSDHLCLHCISARQLAALRHVHAGGKTTSPHVRTRAPFDQSPAEGLDSVHLQAMVNDDVNVRCVRISDTIYDLTLLSASGTPILSVPKYEIVPLP